jgi:hypothetical protein
MALDLAQLVTDYNGAILLQPGTAEWGYVDPQWYLHFPAGQTPNAQHAIGTPAIAADGPTRNFMKANYTALAGPNALNHPDKALFATILRYHLAQNGLVEADLGRRGVLENEYDEVQHQGANWDAPENNIPRNANSASIARYVKKYADTLVHIMVYVFCSRGHHWQDEFDPLYDRLMNACGIQRPTTWILPSNKEMFRQILHCFGIRIPLEYTLYCKNNNRMVNPMRLRFSPHAPIAGAAQITTTFAVLNEMRSEAWWTAFYNKFQDPVDAIANEVAAISQHPYEYHVASRVVTGNAKRDLSQVSMAAFKVLSQYALGYIDYLGRRHSLAGQKVITQKSGGQKALAETFARACDRLGRPSIDVDDMAAFIASL